MSRFILRAIIILTLTITLPGIAWSATAATGDAKKEVKQAVEGFYRALNAMFTGDLGPMTKVWSHKDDVTYMGPAGGFEVGWAAVLADWERQAAMKLGGQIRPENVRITVGQVIAVVHNYEKGENVGPKGKAIPFSIRVTSLFRKEDGTWKMIGHHADKLPYLKK